MRAAFVIECSSRHLRALADHGPRDAYCVELRRTRIGDFDVADADEERLIALDDALDFLPVVELTRRGRRARRPTASPSPARATGIVRLRDADGLIALAEPRGDATLKPVVGFRG